MPALKEVIETIKEGDEEVIKEALDAVGYILYHSKEKVDYDDYLLHLFEKYQSNDIIIWKIIRAMSGTKSIKIKEFLQGYIPKNVIHEQEIKRTLSFIDGNVK